MRSLSTVFVAFFATVFAVLAANTAHAGSVEPTHISLPSGPGSIEGLGRSFAPSLASGTASYGVDIAVPPSVGGFAPHLSLDYDSAGGVTELGMGWRLAGIPSIRRRTENGLPRFMDSDAFEITGMGIPCDLLEVAPGTFRPEYESGAFVRVQRASADSWEARDKSGTTWHFGGEGFVESEGANIAAYLLRESLDLHGHRIEYEWDASTGNALLQRIVWNDFTDSGRNEIVFAYEARPDPHALYSSGIRQVLSKRLTAIEVDHGGGLVRRYELAYAKDIHSRLASVTLVGRDGTSRLPTLSLAYTPQAFQPQLVTMQNPPGRTPADPNIEISDLNGDGLPDLLVTLAGQYRSYINQDGASWLAGADWAPPQSPPVALGATGVQLADLDGDGAIDLVAKSGTSDFRYFPGNDATSFRQPVSIATVPNFTFEDPDTKLADMDGDRRIDVVVTTPVGIAISYNLNGVDWTQAQVVGAVDPKQSLRFSDGGHTQLCDVNGDRVVDFCYLTSGSLVYWLGRGRGVFDPAQTATGVPTFDPSSPWELHDLNGDGWVDLVHIGAGEVDFALAHAEGQFDSPQSLTSVPAKNPTTIVRFADMNASGTTDIVWVDVSGDLSKSWQYLELFPGGRAGLLQRVDNGLGKVTRISYGPAAIDAAAARATGTPWTSRMNVAMDVVRRVTVDDSLGDPVLETDYSYQKGAWSPVERTFAGFSGGTETAIGDAYTPTLQTESTYDVGLDDRTLRGVVLTAEARDTTGVIFSRTNATWTTRQLEAATDGRTVNYSFKLSEQTEQVEGSDVSKARTMLVEWDQDSYGNVISEHNWGEIVGSNKLAGNDEAITIRTYANNAQDWILGRVAIEELQDAAGVRVRMRRVYYDGAPFEGLALGQISRGDVTRQEEWVGPDPNAFELVLGTAYDADGHPIETRDARAGGHLFRWDPSDRTTLLGESAKLEWGVLSSNVDVDRAFGNIQSATGYDGQTSIYQYDPFGRLLAIVRPGDSEENPTVRYTYVAASPLSRVLTDRRVATASDPDEHSEDLIDGLGRRRGALTQDEDGRWVLAGVSLLDTRGQGRRSLRARFVTQADHDSPPVLADAPGVDARRDAIARVIATRTQLGITTRTAFAPFTTSVWDGAQNDLTTPYEHTPVVGETDGLGRTVKTTHVLGGQVYSATNTYDAAGALLTKTDAEGNVSRYGYDGRGRRTLVDDPDTGKHGFVYEATGNLVEHHKPDGAVSRFAFDIGGRPISEDWDGDGVPEVTHTWDRSSRHPGDPLYVGKLVSMADPSGSVENEYDARQRLVASHHTIDGKTFDLGSVYDDQDREVLHVFPDRSSVRIHFNQRGQLSGYGDAVQIDYDGDGVELRRRFNTGVVELTAYDGDRRRTESRVSAANGIILQDLLWTFDGAGNITSVTDRRSGVDSVHDRTESYAYDNFYRLRAATGTWGTAKFSYSPSGNLVERDSSVVAIDSGKLIYGSSAGPHALTGLTGRTVAYDPLGRMKNDGDRSYSWNGDDQLVHVQAATGASVDSIFDGAGERRKRVERSAVGEIHTTYFIDPWSEVRDGRLVRFLVHGERRIAQLADSSGLASNAGVAALTLERKANRSEPLRAVGRLASTLLVALALLAGVAAAAGRRTTRVRRMAQRRIVWAFAVLAFLGCGPSDDRGPHSGAEALELNGTIRTLSESDTLLFGDAIGSLTEQTSGTGTPRAEFAAYPYGLTRFDSSDETRKYAHTPRDTSVGLDQMGARSYAPDLGVWTSPDPVAVDDPTRGIGHSLGASNPYSYASQTPTIATDEKGHWWHIVAAALVGAVAGGAIEAYQQYSATGHIESWGRVGGHALATGASFALFAALPTPATALEAVSATAGVAAFDGVANRLVASGGKSAGTVGQVLTDAGTGAAAMGAGIGVAKVLGKTAGAVLARSRPSTGQIVGRATAAAPTVPGLSVTNDGMAIWVKVAGDPRAFARIVQEPGALHVTDIFGGRQPAGSGSQILAAGLRAAGMSSGQQMVFKGILNAETRATYEAGGSAAESLLGRVGSKALNQLGLQAASFEFQLERGDLNLVIGVK